MNFIKSHFLFLLFPILILSSCALEQNALTKENQEMKSETNINAVYFEEKEIETNDIKHKILIVPFDYTSTNSKYANPEVYRKIFFSSFYNLFSVLPSIDIPDKDLLLSMNPEEDAISNLANRYKCDFIVFGSYSLKGDKSKPDAVISLKIWNKLSGAIITNTATTPTDIELFDAIDSLMAKTVRTMLNEEMKIAYLNFNNFDTGKEPIGIFINHKLVAEPISNNFNLNMKILSGKDYRVAIRRSFDGKLLSEAVANLKPGESKNFSATNLRVNIIKNAGFDEETFKKGTWITTGGIQVLLENNECHIKVKYKKIWQHWKIHESHQLIASPIKIEYGKSYRVSFKARASDIEDMDIIIFKAIQWDGDNAPYYEFKNEKIDKTIKNYMFGFRMASQTDLNSLLEFDFSKSLRDIWLSDVMVEELD
jgi:hypothetical protein